MSVLEQVATTQVCNKPFDIRVGLIRLDAVLGDQSLYELASTAIAL